MCNNKDFIVKVHITAESPRAACEAIAKALLGRGYTWDIREDETAAEVAPWRRNAETIRRFTGTIIGGKSLDPQ